MQKVTIIDLMWHNAHMPLDKRVIKNPFFIISQPKHMLWVLKDPSQ